MISVSRISAILFLLILLVVGILPTILSYQPNTAAIQQNSVQKITLPLNDTILNIKSYQSWYYLLTATVSGIVLVKYSADFELLWRRNTGILGFSDVALIVDQVIVVKQTVEYQNTSRSGLHYYNQVTYHIFDQQGQLLTSYSHRILDLTLSSSQVGFGVVSYHERLVGNYLYIFDFLISDTTNVDQLEFNVTRYNIAKQQLNWTTSIFQTSRPNLSLYFLVGSFSVSSGSLSFGLYSVLPGSDTQYPISRYELDLNSGAIHKEIQISLRCNHCSLQIFDLDVGYLSINYWDNTRLIFHHISSTGTLSSFSSSLHFQNSTAFRDFITLNHQTVALQFVNSYNNQFIYFVTLLPNQIILDPLTEILPTSLTLNLLFMISTSQGFAIVVESPQGPPYQLFLLQFKPTRSYQIQTRLGTFQGRQFLLVSCTVGTVLVLIHEVWWYHRRRELNVGDQQYPKQS